MANIDKKSKKTTPFGEIFSSTSILHHSLPTSHIAKQRINLAELSYLELDHIRRVLSTPNPPNGGHEGTTQ